MILPLQQSLKTLSVMVGVVLAAVIGPAQAQTFTSPDTTVTLLEVYTSQGCSSCPPAEHWLGKFVDDPRLWRQFIPINFHVDYWDYLGWKDPFASAEFSARQRQYQQLGYANNVATPGFIMNGRGWNGWFYGQTPSLSETEAEGVIIAELHDQSVSIRYVPRLPDSPKPLMQQLEVHVAVLGFDVLTEVPRGENRGKKLVHDFVVLGATSQLMTRQEDQATAQLTLPDVSEFLSKKLALVIWVSAVGDPRPIQAAGGWLDNAH